MSEVVYNILIKWIKLKPRLRDCKLTRDKNEYSNLLKSEMRINLIEDLRVKEKSILKHCIIKTYEEAMEEHKEF